MIGIILKIILITYYFVMASIVVFVYVNNKDSINKWDWAMGIALLVFIVFSIGITCAMDFRWHEFEEQLLR